MFAKAKVKPKAKAKEQITAKAKAKVKPKVQPKVQAKAKLISQQKVWAVHLSDTLHRSWKHRRGVSELIFNWSDIGVEANSKRSEILRGVFKRYRDKKIFEVVDLTEGVLKFSSLKKGDMIWGVKDNRTIDRVGRVVAINKNFESGYIIHIIIKWEYKDELLKTGRNIFNSASEIEAVTQEMYAAIKVPASVSWGNELRSYKLTNNFSVEAHTISVKDVELLDKMMVPIMRGRKYSGLLQESEGGKEMQVGNIEIDTEKALTT